MGNSVFVARSVFGRRRSAAALGPVEERGKKSSVPPVFSAKSPTVVPSSNPPGEWITQVTIIGRPVIDAPSSRKRVTVISSTPPWSPGFGPPKASKLVNAVACQVPEWKRDPFARNVVKEPLATTELAPVSKVPEPVTRMVRPNWFSAVLGPTKLKLYVVALAATGDTEREGSRTVARSIAPRKITTLFI